MNPLVEALHKIVEFLKMEKIDYMIIGGIANSIYGNPRQTFDIDIKIDLDEIEFDAFSAKLAAVGKLVPDDPLEFIKKHNVLPIDIHSVRIDLVIAGLDYEKEAINRSVQKDLFGIKAIVTTVEDLIIQKSISTRDKDWLDITELIHLQYKNINWDYLLRHIDELAEFLSDPAISEKIREIRNEI
jgi:hypothetical protein